MNPIIVMHKSVGDKSSLEKTKILLNHYRQLILEIREDFGVIRNNYGIVKSINDLIEFVENDIDIGPVKYSQSFITRVERLKETRAYLETFLLSIEKLKDLKMTVDERISDVSLNKGMVYYLIIEKRYIESKTSQAPKSGAVIIDEINQSLNINIAVSAYLRLHNAAVQALSDILWVSTVHQIESVFGKAV